MGWDKRIVAVALATHLLAVVFTTVTGLNPDATGDASGFARTAAGFASLIAEGTIPVVDLGATYDIWGIFLSPFWFLPGPSRVYARLFNAGLGAYAAYNIYVIATTLDSRRAGLIAATPLIVYPSFLAMHSTVLREAVVLAGLTVVARLYLVPNRLSRPAIHVLAVVVMVPVVILRSDNLPVYLVVGLVAVTVSMVPWRSIPRAILVAALAVFPAGVAVGYPRIHSVVDRLVYLRGLRASGRTVYLGDVFPETVPAAIAFGWIGAAYFLFTPFPWMVETPLDLLVSLEGLTNIVFTIAAVEGSRVLWKRSPAATAALVGGIVLGVFLYGLGTANVGTAVRHRQMVLWAIFLLGGIGIANRFEVVYGESSR